uniref:Rieske domain-containing protein n=1 Tax=Quercus lobata TaxID=97700 RepID=A0A7N2KLE1_QUELO
MEALGASAVPSFHIRTTLYKTKLRRPMFLNFHSNPTPSSAFSLVHKKQSKFKVFNTISSTVSTKPTNPPEPALETHSQGEKFDWYSQWYPVMPIWDLDKRRPHAKKVIGLDVVVWWDRNEETWKVFDDRCPHRLAPLSEGRIDQWGRLQCVYHGWCFNGSGNCKFIPQANPDGPPAVTRFQTSMLCQYLSFPPKNNQGSKEETLRLDLSIVCIIGQEPCRFTV